MSATSITSAVTNINTMDNVGITLKWAGAPVGTFAIQVSNDYDQDYLGNVLSAGTWNTLPLSLTPALGSPIAVNLNQLPFPWIRIVYTKTSGTGTLQAFYFRRLSCGGT